MIELRGVAKAFGPKRAVNNLELSIPAGSVYGFIGPNGAGKTTTIRMIMSIIFPDSGTISVLGKASAVESKDRIGYLPEERGVYRKMRVGAFLNYMGRLKGLDSAGLERRVRQWLERVSLLDCYRKKCEELSKGMQQKVQFIASVLHEPDLVILDEPFSGLDPVNRRLLRGLIDEQRAKGRTIIFSTHAMFEAEQLCTHLFMIHQGNKVLDMPMAEVWRTYDPRAVIVEPMDANGASDDRPWGNFPGVCGVTPTANGVELHLANDADPGAVMAEAARRAPARRLELKRANLEDIFINLVGGDAAALNIENERSAGSGGDA
ncbi:MAG: ATP-binding cassette domain-containing protein [Planctomycetes bacterium]|nr:ATP-binding cassette domain-containing protein [Planctomycetota bacterium]